MARGDLTDTQWARLEPLLRKGKKPGRPPIWTQAAADRRHTVPHPHRHPVAGRTGAVRALGQVYDLFRRWQRDGTWQRIFNELQAQADAKGYHLGPQRRLHRRPGPPARRRGAEKGDLQKEPPGGIGTEPDDHGLGRSRGGLTTKLHLAVEQGQKPMSIVITAGQRGDCPQFEPVLEGIRVPRPGPGRPRTRPVRVRADKAYALAEEPRLPAPTQNPLHHPGQGRPGRHRKKRGSRGGRPPSSTPRTTRIGTRSNAGSTGSKGTARWPRDTTSWRSATRRPSWSRPSTSGCDQRTWCVP